MFNKKIYYCSICGKFKSKRDVINFENIKELGGFLPNVMCEKRCIDCGCVVELTDDRLLKLFRDSD